MDTNRLMDFYTIGLPRTRSLWLSHLLTDENTVCEHEYYSSHEHKEELLIPGKRVGSCDTNPLMAPDYDNKPVIIVVRDKEDVISSMMRSFDKPEGVRNFESFLKRYEKTYRNALFDIKCGNKLIVAFEDLSDPKKVREICDFVGVKITDERIINMISTNISTTNRDLTSPLRHTALCEGVTYEDYMAVFAGTPIVTCERIYDVALALSIFNTCWDEVSADDVDAYNPDVVGEYWIGLKADGAWLGCYRFHQLTTTTWEGHTHMIPECRKDYSTACVRPIKLWMLENLEGMEKLNVTIPELYENVINFCKSIGFVYEGADRLSFKKNGVLHNQIKMGMTRQEIEGSL